MSDRHEKWVPVSPGTVIPAGQPYRYEHRNANYAAESVSEGVLVSTSGADWFIDSSWKPPLVLPTEPTWGIAVSGKYISEVRKWRLTPSGKFRTADDDLARSLHPPHLTDFIPLTDEQVARIEAAR